MRYDADMTMMPAGGTITSNDNVHYLGHERARVVGWRPRATERGIGRASTGKGHLCIIWLPKVTLPGEVLTGTRPGGGSARPRHKVALFNSEAPHK